MAIPRDQAEAAALLGVPADAEADVIADRYRSLARIFHPDRNPDTPDADARMQELNIARDLLLQLRAESAVVTVPPEPEPPHSRRRHARLAAVMHEMPYGVYFIGTQREGDPSGMIADWVLQISFKPRLVLIDPHSLETLPDREYRAGLQEVVQHGLIRSKPLFEFMEDNRDEVVQRHLTAVEYMIEASVHIKSGVVRADEREGGLRRILNFGHTLGHALEAETEYRVLLHGEAVAFGMIAAARLSELRGRLPRADRERIEALVLDYADFPVLKDLDARRVAARIAGDKKSVGGRARFVLAEGMGRVSEELDPPEDQVIEATEHAIKACTQRQASAV